MHSVSRASYKILCVMTQTMGHPALLSIRLTLNKLSLAGQLSREGKSVRYSHHLSKRQRKACYDFFLIGITAVMQ